MSRERQTIVAVADWAVEGADGVLVAYGLGSCVAIMVHDPVAKLGAMAHILLPSASLSRDQSKPAKFPETAVPLLVQHLVAKGGDRRRFVGKLAGGASMFNQLMAPGTVQMGERNIVAARTALRSADIPIAVEDVGGTSGRSIWFRATDGTVSIRSVGTGERTV
jgi:chemotaxis protein CheD